MWQKKNIFAAVVFFLGCILLAGAAALSFLLPSYIEKQGMARVRAGLGVDDLSLEVRRVGLTGIDLGGLVLGPADAPGLAFSGLRLDFSPVGLVNKRIQRAVITGLTVRGYYEKNQLTVPGLPLPGAVGGEKKTVTMKDIPMPVEIGEIVVQGGLLILEHPEGIVRLPFDFVLYPESDGILQSLAATLSLYPMGRVLEMSAALDLNEKKVAFSLAGTLPLAGAAPFIERAVPGMEIIGEMMVAGTAAVSLDPVRLETFRTECEFQRTRVALPGLSLGSGRSGDSSTPMRLIVEGDERRVRVDIVDVMIREPRAVTVTTQAQITRGGEGAIEVRGEVAIRAAGEKNQQSAIGLPLPVRSDYALDLDAEKNWRLKVNGITAGLFKKIPDGPFRISSGKPSFAIKGKGKKTDGRLDISLRLPQVEVARERETVRSEQVTLEARVDRDKGGLSARATLKTAPIEMSSTSFSGLISDVSIKARGKSRKNKSQWLGDWQVVLGEIDVRSKAASAHLSGLNIFGSADYNPDREQVVFVQGGLDFADGTASLPGHEIELSGVSGVLPFSWPPVEAEKENAAGEIAIDNITWQQRPVGPFSTTIFQNGNLFSLTGSHTNKIIPGLKFLFNGTAGLDPDKGAVMQLDFSVPSFTLANFAPGNIFPAAGGLTVGGEVRASGSVALSKGRLDGSARVGIKGGRVEDFEKKLLVEDVFLDLVLPELPRIRSGPAQLLRFGKASFGEITMDSGMVTFQVESPSSFLIEKGSFSWCRGFVYAYALRIQPEKSDYAVTLYCDRLNFAQVLNQFGVAQVEGEGTVNGRIPLTFTKGKIHFDDGFLYSSPGEGGEIHMEAAEMLSAGIPKNTPQFAQIDFAASALKNFKYDWVRLLFQSEREDLIMRMSLYGKPAKRLPFGYRRDIGSFVRLEASSKEGIMQPIQLDANFRLPLNTILGYSGNINELLEKLQ